MHLVKNVVHNDVVVKEKAKNSFVIDAHCMTAPYKVGKQ